MSAHEAPPAEWDGPYRSYDLVKEFVFAVAALALLALVLAGIFGSPARTPATFRAWAQSDPSGFLATTLSELDGSSPTATYGPPYTTTAGSVQSLLGLSPQTAAGRRIPLNSAAFVLGPLERLYGAGSETRQSVERYRQAPTEQQHAWIAAYRAVLTSAAFTPEGLTVPAGDYGPVSTMAASILSSARSGALDTGIVDANLQGQGFFGADRTASELFLADGDYFSQFGRNAGLDGDQWGMAATLNNWPGQFWLLPVAFWYQVPPASISASGDLIVVAIVGVLGAAFLALPFLPGLRQLPVKTGIHRLIWHRASRHGATNDPSRTTTN